MIDNIENSETTTTETTETVVPSETESVTAATYQVSLYIPEIGFVDGTISGGNTVDTSEIVSALEDIKQQQEQQNVTLMNLSVISLLYVALFGIVIAQGFVKLVKR
ncbi:MAG: hypothetical protein ACI4J6_06060 [Oscillospiraceae bacterium]